MPVADVLLVASSPVNLDPLGAQETPPLSKELEVSPGVWLGGVKADVASVVMANTAIRSPYVREQSAMYGLVRYDPPGRYWDEDRAITPVLHLSHLVRATEAGGEFTARIQTDERGVLKEIISVSDVPPAFARAYCAPAVRRRWLTQDDALVLRDLVAAHKVLKPSLETTYARLGVAVSAFGDIPFIYQGRPRALAVAATLEGLVNRGSDRSVKQFTTRVPVLARAVGLPHLDASWADRMYKLRCSLAHGLPLLQAADEAGKQAKLDEFNESLFDLEELLRRSVRKALLDSGFRDWLENVAVHVPVAGTGCPACRSRAPDLAALNCPKCGREVGPP